MNDPQRRNRAPARLTEDELGAISGGPTEELYGAYNFLLETAGNRPGNPSDGFRPPLGSGKGS